MTHSISREEHSCRQRHASGLHTYKCSAKQRLWARPRGGTEMRERRATKRFQLDMPIIVRRVPTLRENDVLNGKTHNISTGGIYFTTERRLTVNEVVDFSLTFAGLVEGADVLVKGRARVLRLASKLEAMSGRVVVAATIEIFHILRA